MKRREVLRVIASALALPHIETVAAFAPVPLLAPYLPGVNLAVGEFNEDASNGGELGVDYDYPVVPEIDYYASKGFKLLRIPFLAKRVVTPQFTLTIDMDKLSALIDYADNKGVAVVIDMHDYGRSRSGALIGQDAGASDEFAACWAAIAGRVRDKRNVIFGLMNEPNEQTAGAWLSGANAAIEAIRHTGANQLTLVPGSYWDGGWKWTDNDNHIVMLGVVDPVDNYAYEVHQYFDADGSGNPNHPAIAGSGRRRLKPFTDWLRVNKKKGFVGEFGFAGSSAYLAEADSFLSHIYENRDVYIGWSVWAGGPRWGDYPFSIEPKLMINPVVDRLQMKILTKYV